MSTKKELRKFARKLIQEHTLEVDDEHVGVVLRSSEFLQSRFIGIYLSVVTEPNTSPIINAAFDAGKRVAVPVYDPHLKIYDWCELKQDTEVLVGKYGIKEPKNAIKINPCDIDVCYIPGLLFDKRGIRLGHGGGYYDRLLVKLSPDTPIIGLSFPWQLVEELPFEAHDIPCCKVITKDR
jgi:5-formyltetrahydrofolate cyclo-ligase